MEENSTKEVVPSTIATDTIVEVSKVKTKLGRPKTVNTESVTQEQFTNLSTKLEVMAELLTTLVAVKQTSIATPSEITEATKIKAAEPEEYFIPKSYRAVVDEILGPEFGIIIHDGSDGTTSTVGVSVPIEKSNARPEHWTEHKCDLRTIPLMPGSGTAPLKEFCERVKKNLSSRMSVPTIKK